MFAASTAFAISAARRLDALVISEIMYHSKEADDADYEYIELYNENPDPLDLSGYTICNGVAFTFPAGTWLDGRTCLVVCANEASIQAKYGVTNTVGDWRTSAASPRLSNGGERVEICNPGGRTVVEVAYNDRGKWPSGADGAGHSLELQSPFVEVDDADHWALSNSPEGSPGLPNPCREDEDTPPAGGDGGPIGVFSGHRDVGLPCTAGDTTFVPLTGVYTTSGSGSDIWQTGDQFQFAWVQVDGDFDFRGRVVSRTWSTSRWGKGGLMARQDFTASSRYVFVHDNPDPDGARMTVRPTHGGSDNSEPYTTADHPSWYRLARSGNTITGYHSTDGFAWAAFGSVAWGGPSAVYLGLALTSHSGCGVATLVWDSIQISGTILPPPDPPPDPAVGARTCTPRVPVVINEALMRTAGERWVELYNAGGAAVDLSGCHLTDDPAELPKSTLPAGAAIPAFGYLSFSDGELGLDFSVFAPGDRVFLALVEPAGDRVVDAYNFEPPYAEMSESRFPDGDPELTDAAEPTRGAPKRVAVNEDIVINEEMYHPIDDDDDDREFIELYNRGAAAVDLGGWRLTRGVNFTFPAGTTVAPGGYLVVARNPALVQQVYGLGANAVIGPEQAPAALDAYGRLVDRGERIRLEDALGRVVDTIHYHDGGEWPRWPDGLGSSLELVDPLQDNRKGQAWDASDDSAQAPVITYEYLGTHGGEESELHIGLLARGITIVDNIEVIGGAVTNFDTDLIGTSEVWRYFKGRSAPPASWNQPGFDDAGCLSGATGIGYGDGDDATVLTDMQSNYLTVFCRKQFTVAEAAAIDEPILRVTVDDGYYAYLNGTLVDSYNVTSAAFDSPAPNAGEPLLIERDISSAKGLLQTGTNVLCVQVHNAGHGSSDLSFIPQLIRRTSTVSGGTNQVVNGAFEADASGWVIEGTHIRSGRTAAEAIDGAGSLKLIASGRGDDKVNRIET